MCSPGYYQSTNGPRVTHKLGHMMYGCTSCAQVHELPWGNWQIGNNQEGTFSVFLTSYIYYTHLSSVRFEHSVCHESFMYIYRKDKKQKSKVKNNTKEKYK